MSKSEKKKFCAGCRDNFYNGNNDLGITECWCLDSATFVMKKKVPIDLRPPWNMESTKVLSCRNERGYIYVDKNRTC